MIILLIDSKSFGFENKQNPTVKSLVKTFIFSPILHSAVNSNKTLFSVLLKQEAGSIHLKFVCCFC